MGTPQNRSFRGSDCLVLLVVLVARNSPAEFYNWHSIFNCEVYIMNSSETSRFPLKGSFKGNLGVGPKEAILGVLWTWGVLLVVALYTSNHGPDIVPHINVYTKYHLVTFEGACGAVEGFLVGSGFAGPLGSLLNFNIFKQFLGPQL